MSDAFKNYGDDLELIKNSLESDVENIETRMETEVGSESKIATEGLDFNTFTEDLNSVIKSTDTYPTNGQLGTVTRSTDNVKTDVFTNIRPTVLPYGTETVDTLDQSTITGGNASVQMSTPFNTVNDNSQNIIQNNSKWISYSVITFSPMYFVYGLSQFRLPLELFHNTMGEEKFNIEELVFTKADNDTSLIHFLNIMYDDVLVGVNNNEKYNLLISCERSRPSTTGFDTYNTLYTNDILTELAYVDMFNNELVLQLPNIGIGVDLFNTTWECRAVLRHTVDPIDTIPEFGYNPNKYTLSHPLVGKNYSNHIINNKLVLHRPSVGGSDSDVDNVYITNANIYRGIKYDKSVKNLSLAPNNSPRIVNVINEDYMIFTDSDGTLKYVISDGSKIELTGTDKDTYLYQGILILPSYEYKLTNGKTIVIGYYDNDEGMVLLISYLVEGSRTIEGWQVAYTFNRPQEYIISEDLFGGFCHRMLYIGDSIKYNDTSKGTGSMFILTLGGKFINLEIDNYKVNIAERYNYDNDKTDYYIDQFISMGTPKIINNKMTLNMAIVVVDYTNILTSGVTQKIVYLYNGQVLTSNEIYTPLTNCTRIISVCNDYVIFGYNPDSPTNLYMLSMYAENIKQSRIITNSGVGNGLSISSIDRKMIYLDDNTYDLPADPFRYTLSYKDYSDKKVDIDHQMMVATQAPVVNKFTEKLKSVCYSNAYGRYFALTTTTDNYIQGLTIVSFTNTDDLITVLDYPLPTLVSESVATSDKLVCDDNGVIIYYSNSNKYQSTILYVDESRLNTIPTNLQGGAMFFKYNDITKKLEIIEETASYIDNYTLMPSGTRKVTLSDVAPYVCGTTYIMENGSIIYASRSQNIICFPDQPYAYMAEGYIDDLSTDINWVPVNIFSGTNSWDTVIKFITKNGLFGYISNSPSRGEELFIICTDGSIQKIYSAIEDQHITDVVRRASDYLVLLSDGEIVSVNATDFTVNGTYVITNAIGGFCSIAASSSKIVAVASGDNDTPYVYVSVSNISVWTAVSSSVNMYGTSFNIDPVVCYLYNAFYIIRGVIYSSLEDDIASDWYMEPITDNNMGLNQATYILGMNRIYVSGYNKNKNIVINYNDSPINNLIEVSTGNIIGGLIASTIDNNANICYYNSTYNYNGFMSSNFPCERFTLSENIDEYSSFIEYGRSRYNKVIRCNNQTLVMQSFNESGRRYAYRIYQNSTGYIKHDLFSSTPQIEVVDYAVINGAFFELFWDSSNSTNTSLGYKITPNFKDYTTTNYIRSMSYANSSGNRIFREIGDNIHYVDGKYIVLSGGIIDDKLNLIVSYSYDAINWNRYTIDLPAVTGINPKTILATRDDNQITICLPGLEGGYDPAYVMKSFDGINWSTRMMITPNMNFVVSRIYKANGYYFAQGFNANISNTHDRYKYENAVIMYSTDAVSWNIVEDIKETYPDMLVCISGVTYCEGRYYVFLNGNTPLHGYPAGIMVLNHKFDIENKKDIFQFLASIHDPLEEGIGSDVNLYSRELIDNMIVSIYISYSDIKLSYSAPNEGNGGYYYEFYDNNRISDIQYLGEINGKYRYAVSMLLYGLSSDSQLSHYAIKVSNVDVDKKLKTADVIGRRLYNLSNSEYIPNSIYNAHAKIYSLSDSHDTDKPEVIFNYSGGNDNGILNHYSDTPSVLDYMQYWIGNKSIVYNNQAFIFTISQGKDGKEKLYVNPSSYNHPSIGNVNILENGIGYPFDSQSALIPIAMCNVNNRVYGTAILFLVESSPYIYGFSFTLGKWFSIYYDNIIENTIAEWGVFRDSSYSLASGNGDIINTERSEVGAGPGGLYRVSQVEKTLLLSDAYTSSISNIDPMDGIIPDEIMWLPEYNRYFAYSHSSPNYAYSDDDGITWRYLGAPVGNSTYTGMSAIHGEDVVVDFIYVKEYQKLYGIIKTPNIQYGVAGQAKYYTMLFNGDDGTLLTGGSALSNNTTWFSTNTCSISFDSLIQDFVILLDYQVLNRALRYGFNLTSVDGYSWANGGRTDTKKMYIYGNYIQVFLTKDGTLYYVTRDNVNQYKTLHNSLSIQKCLFINNHIFALPRYSYFEVRTSVEGTVFTDNYTTRISNEDHYWSDCAYNKPYTYITAYDSNSIWVHDENHPELGYTEYKNVYTNDNNVIGIKGIVVTDDERKNGPFSGRMLIYGVGNGSGVIAIHPEKETLTGFLNYVKESPLYIGHELGHLVDGEDFTTISGGNRCSIIAYGNGIYVGIDSYGTEGSADTNAYYSYDGLTWFSGNGLDPGPWIDVKYGGGDYSYDKNMFVAIQRRYSTKDEFRSAYSYDGITWNMYTPLSYRDTLRLTYGKGVFVVSSFGNSDTLYTNSEGGWSVGNPYTPQPAYSFIPIAYANGKFVSFTYTNINSGKYYSMYSTDGISWTQVEITNHPTDPDPATTPYGWYDMIFANGKFTMICSNTPYVAESIDGIVWSFIRVSEFGTLTDPDRYRGNRIIYGNGMYIIPVLSDNAYYSYNGTEWYNMTLVDGRNGNGNTNICYGNGKFISSYANTHPMISGGNIYKKQTYDYSNYVEANQLIEKPTYDLILIKENQTLNDAGYTSYGVATNGEYTLVTYIDSTNISRKIVKIKNSDNNDQVVYDVNIAREISYENGAFWSYAGIYSNADLEQYYTVYRSYDGINWVPVHTIYIEGIGSGYATSIISLDNHVIISTNICYLCSSNNTVFDTIVDHTTTRRTFNISKYGDINSDGALFITPLNNSNEIEYTFDNGYHWQSYKIPELVGKQFGCNMIVANNKYYLFQYNGTEIYSSTDGFSWTVTDTALDENYDTVYSDGAIMCEYNNGIYIHASYNGSLYPISISTNGTQWRNISGIVDTTNSLRILSSAKANGDILLLSNTGVVYKFNTTKLKGLI